ncbi:hypothetical protein Pmar_PMAR006511 [Perkinsus marinus ATCC 50983]|uniref:Uncharacterized protein n=1 Tax=Perkinsus marinus (strain ATCC 50983 / TXsc) TaxID=423536 RepID=C5K9W5_PERM5|nr:hypothetical protein Pmar_PMAR006511 [Perkinsus marinus ATCC 50983]EER18887.1 hypothetical protein Pmar_PMAR006511 [Perkinsus marinus ATCC 50983]|eukprot:XP_002787091.1 hypothetical protein Pmar_PMAR006511 [Perkinsus marinus ATCC 50983]
MEIPAYMPDPRVMDAILEKMPAPSKKKKDKVIGYIAYLGRTRPNLVAMYLMVNEDDKAAIALYKKTQFVMLTCE